MLTFSLACSPLQQADGGLATLGLDDATSGDGQPTTGVIDDSDDDDDDDDDDSFDTGGPLDDTGDPPVGCQGDEECPPGDSCVGGLCIGDPCPKGEPCDPMAVCRAGAYACVDGEPECAIAGPAPPGVSCGDNQVCDIDGNCVECMDGLPCEPDPCRVGVIACGGGQPQCMDTGPAPQDTVCDLAMFCDDAGNCLPPADCAEILALDETVPTGVYAVDLDGPGGEEPFDVLCDMDTAGGGWTLWPSDAVDALPSNADLPRCEMALTTDCYAGTFAGRGDAEGLFSSPKVASVGSATIWPGRRRAQPTSTTTDAPRSQPVRDGHGHVPVLVRRRRRGVLHRAEHEQLLPAVALSGRRSRAGPRADRLRRRSRG